MNAMNLKAASDASDDGSFSMKDYTFSSYQLFPDGKGFTFLAGIPSVLIGAPMVVFGRKYWNVFNYFFGFIAGCYVAGIPLDYLPFTHKWSPWAWLIVELVFGVAGIAASHFMKKNSWYFPGGVTGWCLCQSIKDVIVLSLEIMPNKSVVLLASVGWLFAAILLAEKLQERTCVIGTAYIGAVIMIHGIGLLTQSSVVDMGAPMWAEWIYIFGAVAIGLIGYTYQMRDEVFGLNINAKKINESTKDNMNSGYNKTLNEY